DIDFHLQGVPKSFAERFPDGNPLLARLLGRTFTREPELRFPTGGSNPEDPHGYTELIRTLADCAGQLDRLRFDVAACSTTGMGREGNEDTGTVVHECEWLEETAGERALIVLADGMGGLAHGEVAAALAVRTLREEFSRDAEGGVNQRIVAALLAANRAV